MLTAVVGVSARSIDVTKRARVQAEKSYPTSQKPASEYTQFNSDTLSFEQKDKQVSYLQDDRSRIDLKENKAKEMIRQNQMPSPMAGKRYEVTTNSWDKELYRKQTDDVYQTRLWNKTQQSLLNERFRRDFDLVTEDISLQDINRYVFRRNHSSDGGMPVSTAGSAP